MKNRVAQGYGCAIAIDKEGNIGKATNSALLLSASIKDNKIESTLKKRRDFDRDDSLSSRMTSLVLH